MEIIPSYGTYIRVCGRYHHTCCMTLNCIHTRGTKNIYIKKSIDPKTKWCPLIRWCMCCMNLIYSLCGCGVCGLYMYVWWCAVSPQLSWTEEHASTITGRRTINFYDDEGATSIKKVCSAL